MGSLMRRSAAEKREIIDLVEHSQLPVGRTLAELTVPRSSFYRWYQRYRTDGVPGLRPRASAPRQFWNRIPETVQTVPLLLIPAAKTPAR